MKGTIVNVQKKIFYKRNACNLISNYLFIIYELDFKTMSFFKDSSIIYL